MKATRKQIELVVKEVAGEEVVDLVKLIKDRKDISEFEIAERLGEEINTTRSLLYKLHQANLVKSVKKRDNDTGWYIFYWSFQQARVSELMKIMKMRELEQLKNKLNEESNGILYICTNKCRRLDFDHASDFMFRCPECGEIMNQKEQDNNLIERLQLKITKLEKELFN